MRYANVIVDISASDVDRLFSYSIPDGMSLVPGHQVAVPFGPRTIEGFVVSVSDTCSLPPEKVKSVVRLVRDYPVILPELVELALWMKGRYLCNLVDALRLMLPSEMRGARVREKTVRVASLNVSPEAAEEYIAKNSRAKKQAEIIRVLKNGDEDTAPHPDWGPALRTLAEKGIITIGERQIRRAPKALSIESRGADPELMPAQQNAVFEITRAMENHGGRFLLHDRGVYKSCPPRP